MKIAGYWLLLASISSATFAFEEPTVEFRVIQRPPSTIYYGEEATVKYRMSYNHLKYYQKWTVPPNTSIKDDSGLCPNFSYQWLDWPFRNHCDFSIILNTKQFGPTLLGGVGYQLYGEHKKTRWNRYQTLGSFLVNVVPHPLSFSEIPVQSATVNLPFYLNLRGYTNYVGENTNAGLPPIYSVIPTEQNGLRYDTATNAFVGTPSKIGPCYFQIDVKNNLSDSGFIPLIIDVNKNPKETPVFKTHSSLASALPNQKYAFNLLSLLETQRSLLDDNQINFRIKEEEPHPSWLSIDPKNGNYLVGTAPLYVIDENLSITLIASSNTGGGSLPFTLPIPVATDPGKKPEIRSFTIEKKAGKLLKKNLTEFIWNPVPDGLLKVVINKIEPAAPWLIISDKNDLEGLIPTNVIGELFHITLHANNSIGGNSDKITIPLQIKIDKKLTPHLIDDIPPRVSILPGKPFHCDLISKINIYPTFEEIPYTFQFAKGYTNPEWLWIESNQLFADQIPETTTGQIPNRLSIHSKPGGDSNEITLILESSNSIKNAKDVP